MTNDAHNVEQFVKLLSESGLPYERVRFWIEKLQNDDFTEDDEVLFKAEMEGHLAEVKAAIAVTEEQLKDREDDLIASGASALPYLRKIHEAQDAFQQKEADDYKKALSKGEKYAMSQIEKFRGEESSEEIEAIRKRLGQK